MHYLTLPIVKSLSKLKDNSDSKNMSTSRFLVAGKISILMNRLADRLGLKTDRPLTVDQALQHAFEDPVHFLDSKLGDDAIRFHARTCPPQPRQPLSDYLYRRDDFWRFNLPNLKDLRRRLLFPASTQHWMEHGVLKVVENFIWLCKSSVMQKIQSEMSMHDHHHSTNNN